MLRMTLIGTAIFVAFVGSALAQQRPASNWRVPRTSDGHPNLQGTWTNATITTLERAQQYGDRLVLTEAEALAQERQQANVVETRARPSDLSRELPPAGDGVGGYNNFWIDRGSRVVSVNGERRSSLIVDPRNGRVPPLLASRRAELAARGRGTFDGPEARPLGERCLLAFGSSSGPPMLPVLYNNHYQIVQNKDHVMILVEMVHDARIVRLNAQPTPTAIRKWMGDSVGRWDGDTLVIETTGFTDNEGGRGTTPQRKVTERLKLIDANTLLYRVTVEDQRALSASWTAEYPFYKTDDLIYEYACHEGNYALPGILAGAREQEKAPSR